MLPLVNQKLLGQFDLLRGLVADAAQQASGVCLAVTELGAGGRAAYALARLTVAAAAARLAAPAAAGAPQSAFDRARASPDP